MAAQERWSVRLWTMLVVVCGAVVLDALDVSMTGIALPSIRANLHMSTSSLQWVVSGYVLGYGGFLLLGGRAADLFGRRRIFLIATAAFSVASLVSGLAFSGGLLIAARFVKGIAAGFTAPAAISIVTTTFVEGPSRNRAMGIVASSAASGFSLGLVLSGLLTSVSWRWTLLAPAPVALAMFFGGMALIPQDAPVRRERFDILGAFAITGALLLFVYGIVQGPEIGWSATSTVIALVFSAVLLVFFIVLELRIRHPLIRLAIFRSSSLVRANIGAMTSFGCYLAFQFVVTQYLQIGAHWSAIGTALAFLPAGIIVATGSPRVAPLSGRIGTRWLIAAGMGCFVIAYVWFTQMGVKPDYPAVILPAILLIGVAFALSFSTLQIQATNGVANEEQGLAAGLVQTSFQIGGAVVLAIVSAVVSSEGAERATGGHALVNAYRPALAVLAGLAALGAVVATTGRDRRPAPEREPEPDTVIQPG